MDLKVNVNAAMLLYQSMIKGKNDCGQTDYYPQKTEVYTGTEEGAFSRLPLNKSRIPSESLLSLLQALSEDREARVHSLMLLEDGKCLLEASAPGYSTRTPHITYSLCKTVTGLAIGMLMDDGLLSLQSRVWDLLPESRRLMPLAKTRSLTVEHLLTMSSGVAFGEAGAVTETNWRRAFLESAVRFEPGRGFAYNSMNSYMLSAIVCRLSGKSMSEFLQERLWTPIGAKGVFWEKDPAGIEKGGWGLYLSVQDMAKLGQLYLDGGVYQGKRLVSEAFIRAATTAQNSVPDRVGAFDYGYQLWVAKDGKSFLFNGMLGQNVWVLPEKRLVLAMTAGDSCMFQDTTSLQNAIRILSAPTGEKKESAGLGVGGKIKKQEKDFGKRINWIPLTPGARDEKAQALRFAGQYGVSINNALSLPYVTRLVQNNHAAGIESLTLSEGEGDTLALSFAEGGEVNGMLLGRRRYCETVVEYRGECYRVLGAYAMWHDEDGLDILKIELKFPELATTRRMILRYNIKGNLCLSMSETPGYDLIAATAESVAAGGGAQGPLLDFLNEKVNMEQFLQRAKRTFSPKLTLTPLQTEEKLSIL